MQKISRYPLPKIAVLGVVLISGAALLFLGYLKLFNNGRLPGVLNTRTVIDGLGLAVMGMTAGLYLFFRPQSVRSQALRRGRFEWRWVILLGVVILLAAFLRFHKLELQSLWRDEIATVARMESASLPDALELGLWQDAWPSYHILLYGFVRLAGDSEFAFRFPSALAGVLLIPTLFVLGRRMFSAREGLIAAGLAAAIRTPLWYSQEARSYSFLVLFAALSGYFWFRMAQELVWRGRPGRLALVGFVASSILTAYAHYLGLVLIAVEGLGALLLVLRLRRIPVALVAAFAAIGLAYLPWVPLLFADLGKGTFWAGKPSWFGGMLFGFFIFLFRDPLNFIVLGLAGASIATLLWQNYRHRGSGMALPLIATPGVVLIGWLLLPFAIIYFRSLVSTPILVNRYLLVSLPPAYLLASRAVTRLPFNRTVQGLAGVGLVGFVCIHLAASQYYVRPNKTQLRETVAYIASHESQYPNAVVIAAFQGGKNELDYYFRKFGSSSTIDIKAANAWHIDSVRAQLAERQPDYVWLIGQRAFVEPEFRAFLDHDYRRIDEARFYDVSLTLYKR